MRTYTPQSSNKKTACKVRAPHLRKPWGLFGCKGLKCMWPSSITAAFPLQLRRSRAHANVSAWTSVLRVLRNDRWFAQSKECTSAHTHHILYRERARAHTHTPYLEREHAQYLERERSHTQYLERGREGRERESTISDTCFISLMSAPVSYGQENVCRVSSFLSKRLLRHDGGLSTHGLR